VQTDMAEHEHEMEHVKGLTDQFGETAHEYDRVAMDYDPPAAEGPDAVPKLTPEELEEITQKRKHIIEYEVWWHWGFSYCG